MIPLENIQFNNFHFTKRVICYLTRACACEKEEQLLSRNVTLLIRIARQPRSFVSPAYKSNADVSPAHQDAS